MKISKSKLRQIIKEETTAVLEEVDPRPCAQRSDGCTSVPDGDKETGADWRHCCVDHDCCYVAGGTEGDRKNCGGPGDLYYYGVRRFGKPYFNFRKKKIAEARSITKKQLQRIIKEELGKVLI